MFGDRENSLSFKDFSDYFTACILSQKVART